MNTFLGKKLDISISNILQIIGAIVVFTIVLIIIIKQIRKWCKKCEPDEDKEGQGMFQKNDILFVKIIFSKQIIFITFIIIKRRSSEDTRISIIKQHSTKTFISNSQ
jgi:hypothetical protein